MWADYDHINYLVMSSSNNWETVHFDKKAPIVLLKTKLVKELKKRDYGYLTATELNFIIQKAKKNGKLIFKKFRYGGYSIL